MTNEGGAVKESVATLYDTDFYAWTQQRAELTNRLAQLSAHLLKWEAQPAQRPTQGRSLRLTIAEQRRQIDRLMRKNPSLKPVPEAMADAWVMRD